MEILHGAVLSQDVAGLKVSRAATIRSLQVSTCTHKFLQSITSSHVYNVKLSIEATH